MRLRFGRSVALSADGNTALIGGRADCGGAGDAWVFTRSGSTWTQQGPRIADPGKSTDFGSSVALSADGSLALIGAPEDNKSAGAVWPFARESSTWTRGEKLTGSGEVGKAGLGVLGALDSDAGIALIGGGGDQKGTGAVWAFTRDGSTWSQQGEKLTGSGEITHEAAPRGAAFAASVALSSDGNTALVGGPADNRGVGAVWVFTREASTWTQQGEKLTRGGEPTAQFADFGGSVALSAAGDLALIGAREDEDMGSAWVFTRANQTWSEQGEKLTAGGPSGAFGHSVALSSDAKTALIGGPNFMAAWVFVNNVRSSPRSAPRPGHQVVERR